MISAAMSWQSVCWVLLLFVPLASASAGGRCDSFGFLPSANIADEYVQVRAVTDAARAVSYNVWIRPTPFLDSLLPQVNVTMEFTIVFFRRSVTGDADTISLALRISSSELGLVISTFPSSSPLLRDVDFVPVSDLLNGHWRMITVTADCFGTPAISLYFDGSLLWRIDVDENSYKVLCPTGPVFNPTTRLLLGGTGPPANIPSANGIHPFLGNAPFIGELFGLELYDYVLDAETVAAMWAQCEIPPGNLASWLDRPVFDVARNSSVKLSAFDHRCCNRYNQRKCEEK